MVSRGQVTAPPPVNRVSGRAARLRLKTALSPRRRTRPTPSRTVTAGSLSRVAIESMSMVNGSRSGVAIRSRPSRVLRSDSRITRRSPSGLSSIIRPGLARSAPSAESFWVWVRSDRSGFQGSAIRSVPSSIRTLWKSTSGDLPPGVPFPIRSTSS